MSYSFICEMDPKLAISYQCAFLVRLCRNQQLQDESRTRSAGNSLNYPGPGNCFENIYLVPVLMVSSYVVNA